MHSVPHSRHYVPRPGAARRLVAAVATLAVVFSGLLVAAPAASAAVSPNTTAPGATSMGTRSVDAGASAAVTDTVGSVMPRMSLDGFDSSNLIDDAVFYDGAAMTSVQIQTFLDQRIGTCQSDRCINVLSVSISSRAARYSTSTGALVCNAIQGGSMRVSELIYRMQSACGISAKAILVILQKEQGLVTSRNPSDWNLSAAMGQACPDTAPCDPNFAGVGPQIVAGVTQLKTYMAARFGKQPGNNFIQYNPNAGCGGTVLNLQNYATAALYNYTPYQPNSAALRAGYGLGDACSSYGNRNFYNYYTDWFGSTRLPPAINQRYVALGGADGRLGEAVGQATCGLASGGCAQNYRNGTIYWTAATGAWESVGSVRTRWGALGYENGRLGYPTTGESCSDTGCSQGFQGGAIYWSAGTGAWESTGGIRARWAQLGYEAGVLGYPSSAETCTASGCSQAYQSGAIYWSSATGAWESTGPIRARWGALGYESGQLGYPASALACTAAGCTQSYQRGDLSWSSATGAWVTTGAIGARWNQLGRGASSLGYPTADQTCDTTTCSQSFSGGSIFWSTATGAWDMNTAIRERWTALGAASGRMGYPTSGTSCSASGCAQAYQGGAMYWSSGAGAWESAGAIRARWAAVGYESGAMGYPAGAETCTATTCSQKYVGGTIYWASGAGTWDVGSKPDARYQALGGPQGTLGFPSGAASCSASGCAQVFRGGVLYWTPTTAAFESRGTIRDRWGASGYESGRLGYPISGEQCTTDGCSQTYQGGVIAWSARTGAHATVGAIGARYAQMTGVASTLGFPAAEEQCGTTTCVQRFAAGYIYWSAATGAWESTGPIRDAWAAVGYESGRLGLPISAQNCTSSQCTQTYQGGVITWTQGQGSSVAYR
ncbi:LGFP repeat-containing protein [Microbacterium sp. cx-59]|uniref:LGFP repeat-containing protein n=1 Tax=Microbacterium sp. cx-59 TaxID=2891207 RepID=UPI001E3EFBA1|nr:hypothetical protein [Microbacterium sp. cx-59]MCC4907847.1 hypothetical protein [Microbacterium sp. cx-59]